MLRVLHDTFTNKNESNQTVPKADVFAALRAQADVWLPAPKNKGHHDAVLPKIIADFRTLGDMDSVSQHNTKALRVMEARVQADPDNTDAQSDLRKYVVALAKAYQQVIAVRMAEPGHTKAWMAVSKEGSENFRCVKRRVSDLV